MNNEVYFSALKEMNKRFPQKELGYRNKVVASAIALGEKDKLILDWVIRTLLMDVEDEIISYEQAVYIYKDYYKAIEEIKKSY